MSTPSPTPCQTPLEPDGVAADAPGTHATSASAAPAGRAAVRHVLQAIPRSPISDRPENPHFRRAYNTSAVSTTSTCRAGRPKRRSRWPRACATGAGETPEGPHRDRRATGPRAPAARSLPGFGIRRRDRPARSTGGEIVQRGAEPRRVSRSGMTRRRADLACPGERPHDRDRVVLVVPGAELRVGPVSAREDLDDALELPL